MKSKIIPIKNKFCKEVLLYITCGEIDKSEIPKMYIEIVAWHFKDDGYLIQTGNIIIENADMETLEQTIKDYSPQAAELFASKMKY